MKKFPFLLFILTLSFCANAQKIDNVDSFYQDKGSLLIKSKVISVDSVTSAELQKHTKNWAATAFVNLKEVLVGETEDQLTFVYINDAFYVKSWGTVVKVSWYIRLVVQTKNGKAKVSFYDDGNVMMTNASARSIHLSQYFPGGKQQKPYSEGLWNLRESILTTLTACKKGVSSVPKEDW